MLKLLAFITLCYFNYFMLKIYSVVTNKFIRLEKLHLITRAVLTIIFTLLWVSLVVMIILTIRYCILVII